MQTPIKTGLLSFGLSGTLFHAPFINMHEGFNLHAIVERSEKKAHLKYPGVKSYSSIDELIGDPEIELVIVNTPNVTHFEFALKAIRANKHVLVEKPFTLNSHDAKLLFEEGKKYNRFVMPYQNRRYDTDYTSVKEIIDSNKLGRLVEMHVRFDRYRYTMSPKPAKENPHGGGVLFDLGPHALDGVIALFGKPLSWTKSLGHFRPGTKVDDYASIQLNYAGEFKVFITTSMLVAGAQPAFVIHGVHGSYIKQRTDRQEPQLLEGISPLDAVYGTEEQGSEGLLTLADTDGKTQHEKIAAKRSSYMNLFDAVYQAIREEKTYPITEEQIIQQLVILE